MSTTVTRKQYNPEGTDTVLGLPCETITETFDGSVTAGNVVIDDVYSIKELTINDNHSTGVLSMLSKIAEIQKQIRNDEADFPMPTIKGYTIDSNGNADLSSGLQEDVLEEVESVEGMTVDGIKVVRAWKPTTNKSYSSIAASSSLGDVVFKMLTPSQASQFSAMLPSGSTMNTKEASVNIENGGLSSIDDTSKTYNLMAILSKNNCLFCGLIGVNVGIGGCLSQFNELSNISGVAIDTIISLYLNNRDIVNYSTAKINCSSKTTFDTGLQFNDNYTYEIKVKADNNVGVLHNASSWDKGGNNEFCLWAVSLTTIRIRGRVVASEDISTTDDIHILKVTPDAFYIDGVSKITGTKTCNTKHDIYIGADPAVQSTGGFVGDFYYMKVSDTNNTTLQYIIPTSQGLLDLVGGQILSIHHGSFTYSSNL